MVDGDLTIANLDLEIAGYPLNTNDYVLPLTSNITIDIRSGKTTFNNTNGFALLPGVKFLVSKGAIFDLECDMYVYDREAWVGASNKFAYNANLNPIQYVASTKSWYKRTDSEKDMPDASVDVNGTLLIGGHLYTTHTESDETLNGANIFSSDGTGKIIFNQSTNNTTSTNQYSNNSDYVSISCTTAKLKNDGDGSYTFTTDAPAGAVYYYDVDEDDKGEKRWYQFHVDCLVDGISHPLWIENSTQTTLDIGEIGTIKSVSVSIKDKDGKTKKWDLDQNAINDISDLGSTLDLTKINVTEEGTTSDLLTAVRNFEANAKKGNYVNKGNITITIATSNEKFYKPVFLLNQKQYGLYQTYAVDSKTLETQVIDGETYYVYARADEAVEGGSTYAAPVIELQSETSEYLQFNWFLDKEITTTKYDGNVKVLDKTLPSGSEVYYYGGFAGSAVCFEGDYNLDATDHPSKYFTTIAEVMNLISDPGTITYSLKMLADNDAFDDDGGKYTIPANRDITLDLNGFTVTGTITNNGTLTIQDGSQTGEKDGTGMVTSTSNNTITNNGTLTLESGKFVSTGGAIAVLNSKGTLNVGTGAAFNGKNATSANVISGTAKYPDGYQLSTSRVDGYFRVVLAEVTITWIDGDSNKTTSQVKQGDIPKYPGTTDPVKTPGANENCKYKFTGWKPELTAATADAVYEAQFETVDKIRMTSGDTVDYFNTLQEAAEQSPEGATLTLQKSLDAVSGAATFTKTQTLNLNGQTSSGNITVNSDVTLTITGTGTISAACTAILNKGTLILPTGITVNATGNDSIALDNSGTIDSITGGTFTAKAATNGNNAIALRNTGTINTISGGKFQGHTAVQIEQTGVLTAISGGTFEAETGGTVICNNSTNPVTLSGSTTRFGGVDESDYVLNGVSNTSKFKFDPANMTISTSKNSAGYFTIVANTFTLVFNVDGTTKKVENVPRTEAVDLSERYGPDPTKNGYQFNGWTLNGTNIGKGTVTQTQLGTPGTGDTVTVYATWNIVYSVTVTWGSLEYDYKGATYVWDGQSMKYKVQTDAHWESVDQKNTVQVTNSTVAAEGTVQVKAKYEKSNGYTFDLLQNGTSLTTEQKLGEVASKGSNKTNTASWSFSLSGKPSGDAFTKDTVGKITLTLQPGT